MQTNKTTIIKIIINTEKYLTSLAKDFTSLAILGFFFWFNYKFIGGSYFVNFLILLYILMGIVNLKITKSDKNSSVYFNVSQDKIDRIESILNEDQHPHK